jgi:phage tail sheath gpL-like
MEQPNLAEISDQLRNIEKQIRTARAEQVLANRYMYETFNNIEKEVNTIRASLGIETAPRLEAVESTAVVAVGTA